MCVLELLINIITQYMFIYVYMLIYSAGKVWLGRKSKQELNTRTCPVDVIDAKKGCHKIRIGSFMAFVSPL